MEFKCFFLKCELNGGKGKEGNISAKNFAYIMSWELWMEVHNTVKEAVTKTTPKKKKCKKAKQLSEEALKIAEKRREAEDKGDKDTLN